ncbi:MAG: CBS domain-containing protein [Proteobacteria bacterium]|nr:CBS domain-containing protein [Pseudomonadota bacterium]
MIVGMWMTRELICAQPDTPLGTAAKLMAHNGIRRLPVVVRHEDGLALLGIVSATDLYRAYPAHCNPFTATEPTLTASTTAAQIMTESVLTTSSDVPIEDAATIMRDRKIGALPVMRQDRLIGLITESDIFRAFISILQGDSNSIRLTFSIANGEDLIDLIDGAVRNHVQLLSLMTSRKEGQSMCVARIAGAGAEMFIESLWRSGHQVVNVLRTP